jgi:hypothetical protein
MGREGSILLVLAVAALSCAQTPPPVVSEVQRAADTPPTFERRSVERTRGDCAEETAPCARFVAQFFVVSGGVRPPVREAVNRSLLGLVAGRTSLGVPEDEGDEPPATIDEAAIEFFSGWAESRAELPEDAPAAYARWVDERRLEVIHADHQVLSVELGLYAFTGGAHPNTFIELASFDLATGKPLELADLVAAGADARLAALGERQFRKAREIPEGESLEEAGFWFEDDRFELSGNFAVTAEGLAFVFNPYEVAPYVFGPTRITLPWKELRGLLRPGAPGAPAAATARGTATRT